MKKSCLFLILTLLLFPAAAGAQRITMEEAHLSFDYPESWLVLSPQLAGVYEPLLDEHGLSDLSEELVEQSIHTRAYSPDFAECMSVLTGEDDTSAEVYDIERMSDAERKRMKSRAEANGLWETTGYRAQDVEWQKIGGTYWLYIHYTRTRGDAMIGRGLRYMTIRNGQYIQLDWQIGTRRFTNKDLAGFRARVSDLVVTESLPEPMRAVKLTAQIPAETSTAEFVITGETTPGATLVAEAPDSQRKPQTLSVGTARENGSFSLNVTLEDEGEFPITLTASREGMTDAAIGGVIRYSAKTLPVTLELPEGGIVQTDKLTVNGTTLGGVSLQLVAPKGVSKKRSGNSGAFSFELNLKEEGTYDYTLILSKKGFNDRRVNFSLIREITQAQQRQQVRESADRIAYKTLQKDLPENRGKTLRIYGPVISVEAGGNVTYIRMHYTKDAKGNWSNPVYVVANEALSVKPGDMLTVVATVAGVFEEQDASGQDVMIPRLEMTFVDGVE